MSITVWGSDLMALHALDGNVNQVKSCPPAYCAMAASRATASPPASSSNAFSSAEPLPSIAMNSLTISWFMAACCVITLPHAACCIEPISSPPIDAPNHDSPICSAIAAADRSRLKSSFVYPSNLEPVHDEFSPAGYDLPGHALSIHGQPRCICDAPPRDDRDDDQHGLDCKLDALEAGIPLLRVRVRGAVEPGVRHDALYGADTFRRRRVEPIEK